MVFRSSNIGRNSMKPIFDINKRDIKGLWGWLIVTLIVGIVALPIMIGREIYQCVKYRIDFEWDDIKRYSVVIGIGSIVHYILLFVLL